MNKTCRRFLATSGTVLLGGVAGCTGSSRSQTETGTTTESEVSTVTQTSETANGTDRRSTTDTERADTRTATQEPTSRDTETPNEIRPQKQVQQFTTPVSNSGLLNREKSENNQNTLKTIMLTTPDWRAQINPELLDDEVITMLDETDYSSTYVAGFEESARDGVSYRLNAVERIADTLRFCCTIVGTIGRTIVRYRLLLVRLPRDSRELPDTVAVDISEETPTPSY